ncbi:hypothetical protein HMPREF9988_03042, partial [Staphylococcus epidermidis NIHLM053]|uniref:phage antirepressor KilAC domain-containing protein n=1 Tax=Staphylococcus epidermidis TaxID=1282 RepID=UPI00026C1D18
EAAKSKVELLEPKAQALETIANTDGTYTIRECAKTINIGERKLISLLIDKKWIYREEHGRLQLYSTVITPYSIHYTKLYEEVDYYITAGAFATSALNFE